MSYNPLDLVTVSINGSEISARPISLSGDIFNNQTMTDSFGDLVKPTSISTICPDCGNGLIFDVQFGDYPFDVIEFKCNICNVDSPTSNPFLDITIDEKDLDPALNTQLSTDGSHLSNLLDSMEFDESDDIQSLQSENLEESEILTAMPKPETTTEEPEATTEELEEPEATTEEPEATTEEPEATTEEPEATTEEPEATTEEPEATTEEPEATTEEPEPERPKKKSRKSSKTTKKNSD